MKIHAIKLEIIIQQKKLQKSSVHITNKNVHCAKEFKNNNFDGDNLEYSCKMFQTIMPIISWSLQLPLLCHGKKYVSSVCMSFNVNNRVATVEQNVQV